MCLMCPALKTTNIILKNNGNGIGISGTYIFNGLTINNNIKLCINSLSKENDKKPAESIIKEGKKSNE